MENKQKKTVILGASDNPARYSYLALNRLKNHGHPIVAIGRKDLPHDPQKASWGALVVLQEGQRDKAVGALTVGVRGAEALRDLRKINRPDQQAENR